MSIEESNVAILRDLYAQWNSTKGGSVDRWLEYMAEEVDWRSLADGAAGMEFTRAASTREQVGGYMRGLLADWQMDYYAVDEFVAQGDRVVMLGRCAWVHRATGKRAEMPKADAIRLKDGKIVAFMEYFDTAGAFAATLA